MSKLEPLKPGETAPVFTYRTADGVELSTYKLSGSPYLVYFYPKDNTPGCTKEACAFRDSFAGFEEAGVTVIGVSADSEASHEKFRKKYELPFALCADPEHTVIEAFGVWDEKKFMGRVFDGIHRISFLIGPDGKIAKTYPKVKPETHAAEVLKDASTLC